VTAPLLEITGLSKGFPGVKALDSVDLKVQTGEIHALMGENGAGKSTLIKVLTGVFPRDAGETRLDGQIIAPKSPREAEALGISTVYQEVKSDSAFICSRKYLSGAATDLAWRHPLGCNRQAGQSCTRAARAFH